MLIGYARVSTNEQILDLQHDALLKAGCIEKHIYTDKITGLKQERKGLDQALSHLREGDTFVVWRLDRLGRSLKHLIETITNLQSQGIAFKSLTENIDTSTATGQLVFHIFGALAEFERNLIKERTIAGLDAARSRGDGEEGQSSKLPHPRCRWRKKCMLIKAIKLMTSVKR